MKLLRLTDEEFALVDDAVIQAANNADYADPDFEDPEFPNDPASVRHYRALIALHVKLRDIKVGAVDGT